MEENALLRRELKNEKKADAGPPPGAGGPGGGVGDGGGGPDAGTQAALPTKGRVHDGSPCRLLGLPAVDLSR